MPDTDPFIIHFNARIHGMKSKLFSAAALEEFLGQGDPARLSDALLESEYKTQLAEALTRFEGADAIEEAVTRNLVDTFHSLVRRAQGDYRELVRIFLARWDLAAVKALIRCQAHGITGEAAKAIVIPGPNMTVALIDDFVQHDSMESLIHALAAWNSDLCRSLVAAFPAYQEHQDLGVLEEALDRAYYVVNIRRLGKREDEDSVKLLAQLRSEVDRINIRLVLGAVESGKGGAIEARLLPYGFLPHDLLVQMSGTADSAAALDLISGTRYKTLVQSFQQSGQLRQHSALERSLEHMHMTIIRRESRKDVFGIGVFMDYVMLKYNEVVNLRLIARALAGQLPAERVRKEMFVAA